uniref:Uncharacterized protein n=1 Tax=Anguilla anguilla TaxID=7936 RepID=A0A0E9Q585_ANGAN
MTLSSFISGVVFYLCDRFHVLNVC